jgi:hypothetical protein
LLAHYSQSFIIEDDSLEAHRSVSESLATSAPLGDTMSVVDIFIVKTDVDA